MLGFPQPEMYTWCVFWDFPVRGQELDPCGVLSTQDILWFPIKWYLCHWAKESALALNEVSMKCPFSYLTGGVLLCLPLLFYLLAVMPKLRQGLLPYSLCSLQNQSFPKASSGHRLLGLCRNITISMCLFCLKFTHGKRWWWERNCWCLS